MSISIQNRELLDKLIHGTISDHEKWQLEKASLDDPFLADAIEGYYDNNFDIKSLEEIDFTKTKIAKRKISIWKPLMVAASFLLLIAVSFWFMNDNIDMMTHHSSNHETAEVSTTMQEDVSTTMKEGKARTIDELSDKKVEDKMEWQSSEFESLDETTLNSNVEEFKSKTAVPPNNKNEQRLETNQSKSKQSADDSDVEFTNEEEVAEVFLPTIPTDKTKIDVLRHAEKDDVVEKNEVEEMESDDVILLTEDVSSKLKIVSPTAPIHTVKGFVFSKSGTPIPDAQVFTALSNEKVVTNDEGFFVMNVSDMNQSIKAVHADYNPQSTLLAPEVSFNLTEIQGSFAEGSKTLVEMMSSEELKVEYAKVLDRHFISEWKLCEKMENTIRRRAKVQLRISDKGKLQDIDFIGNLPQSCREEVHNFILEGVKENIFQGTVETTFIYTYHF